MTLLDDDIDDLLQAFRADEARIDDIIRSRIWARVCDAAPDAPTALDTLDRGARVRRLRQRVGARPRARVLAVAAAVLVLIAVGGLTIRSGPDDDAVTAGPASTVPLPRTLQELADVVTVLPTSVLGDPGAAYTYRQGVRTVRSRPAEDVTFDEQQWIARDGTGRERARGDEDTDVTRDEPGSLALGPFTPAVAIALPDDADAVAAAIAQGPGDGVFDTEDSPGLIDVLTYAGLPGPARAGVLRALDRLDFVPVPAPGLAPNLVRVEGPGPDGSMMQADLDRLTGEAVTTVRTYPGGFDRLSEIEVDLRRDTEGS